MIIVFDVNCLEVTLALFVCVWAIRRQASVMIVKLEGIRRGIN